MMIKAAIVMAVFACCSLTSEAVYTALDEYIALPDPTYSYFDTGHNFSGPGYDAYILNMTSQQWLTYNDVSQSIWWHYMVVVVPHNLKFTTSATLYITGGSQTDGYPNAGGEDDELCITLALADHVICVVLFQIPNQPIVFAADPTHESRSEDALIAFTWWHFINVNSSEPFWLARLPMTKAAVRAMDTITDYCGKKFGYNISTFIVAGASKRGWTTWTTAAVDPRVIAIIPIVMDALNFIKNVHHFWQALGGWSFALSDYYAMNFTRQIDLPQTAQMTGIIDPLVYASRLTMPKLVVDAGGDEFFMPDDNHYWWDLMPNEKHILFVQDAEHSLATGLPEVDQSITAFIYGVLSNTPRPQMTWDWYNGTTYGNLTIYTSVKPSRVVVWHANTLDDIRRDWRPITGQKPCPTVEIGGGCFHPVFWFNSTATVVNDLTYTVTMEAPTNGGWKAFFMTAEFPGVDKIAYLFSTQVVIVPNVFPFSPCYGDGCYGTLL